LFKNTSFLDSFAKRQSPSIMFHISIDTGGTFTDCIATDSQGNEYRCKVLSNSTLRGIITSKVSSNQVKVNQNWDLNRDIFSGYIFRLLNTDFQSIVRAFDAQHCILTLDSPLPDLDSPIGFELTAHEEAPILGARILTQTSLHEPFPKLTMHLGSTKGTNALLEGKGAKTLFVVTKGFKDLLLIGNQARPDIFAQQIIKPKPLYSQVLEIDEQTDAQGNILKKETAINHEFEGIESVAICLKNAYKNPENEQEIAQHFQKNYDFVSVSTELSAQAKLLNRAETTVVNAYLSPIIHRYLENISAKLPSNSLHVMTSAGSLVRSDLFQPKDSLFSGPAGGVVGAAVVAQKSGFQQLLTFDMGGTSTDVARYDGQYEYQFSQQIGNAHIFSPALAIETVAAGGGSICSFDGLKLSVGPESAGAFPGPACYGAGGPLSITDVNLLLGRLDTSAFGIPIFKNKAQERLYNILAEIHKKGFDMTEEALLEGFRAIANEKMAEAIRKISVAKGYDATQYSLLAFGGAGGLHACSIAQILGIKHIILPKDAGLLSAYGISQAEVERFAESSVLEDFSQKFYQEKLNRIIQKLQAEVFTKLIKEGFTKEEIKLKKQTLFLRFRGQDASLEIDLETQDSFEKILEKFKQKYIQIYGHWTNRSLEIEAIRVLAGQILRTSSPTLSSAWEQEIAAQPDHFIEAFFDNSWQQIPVFIREKLPQNSQIKGFALLLDRFSTTVIEKNWTLRIDAHGTALCTYEDSQKEILVEKKYASNTSQTADLELFTNRFMTIAEQMGVMLQRTSVSVNVKERLDFSCALLNHRGELIANAPHIPVHLGSLGVCVRSVIPHIEMSAGDVVVTNHPKYGGSHLPDVTVISAVYDRADSQQLIGYVVNRCHHAEIGGIRPASMPPDATNLAQEGVVIEPMYLVKNGIPQWENIEQKLTQAAYPTRALHENLADLNAALAANKAGETALQDLCEKHGCETVHYFMELLQEYSAQKMTERLQKIPSGRYIAQELLDDGSPLKVQIDLSDTDGLLNCIIDFEGSAGVHSGNLNANEAIVNSVVIYVLRLLLAQAIPLNDGLLRVVQIKIPDNSILKPYFPEDSTLAPAVVGGNVELSQRLTDTLLKAFGILACSQGTMNNTLFGNEKFGYYETVCGGSGAGNGFDGESGVHTHMTNTRITDPEILELRYPVRLLRFEIRENSGGKGLWQGGNGIIREMEFLEKVQISVLTQHRKQAPYGLNGGGNGQTGQQQIIRKDETIEPLAGVAGASLYPHDRLLIQTPGGGGFGQEL
jgi:5-oxoprolinase (ATP-hydrolysing)